MDFKKTNAPTNTVTRDLVDFVKDTGNIYESVAIMGKRANQISVEMKDELKSKLEEFSSTTQIRARSLRQRALHRLLRLSFRSRGYVSHPLSVTDSKVL